MAAAFEFDGQECGTDTELFERCVRRAAEIASANLEEGHPVTAWLNSAKNSIGDGTVLSIGLSLPNPQDRAALADVLAAVSREGLRAGGGLFATATDDDDDGDLFDAVLGSVTSGDWASDDLMRLVALLRA